MVRAKNKTSGIPSLDDVAVKAGVSKSTASRVLNNRLGNGFSVKEEVRQRVIKIAAEMNYRPNLIAKSLTMRSTRMIHIFGGNHALSDLGNIYQTVVNNITQVMDFVPGGYDVTVDMSRHTPDESEMPAWRIDGAIILAQCNPATMREITQMGIPYVIINGTCPPEGCSVVPDDIGGTQAAVRHLIELGHTRIAYSGPLPTHLAGLGPRPENLDAQEYRNCGLEADVLASHSSLRDRYLTFIAEMQARGLEPILSCHDALESAEDYLGKTFRENKVTAIVAYGHMGALNLLQAAHTLDIAVPEQLSLLCFCDEYANRIMSPGLTFIDLNSAEMGRQAANLLLQKIREPQAVDCPHIVLPEKLVVRKTTARPFAAGQS
ncbi:MAG: LacI family transcriptional regulator [Planctomycetaceae bacterium]|nr:LacI family transcriptional regulator [Planctomycetaceae bacterium]